MTNPDIDREQAKHIPASRSLSPAVPVLNVRSLPARSTNASWLT